MQKEQDAWAYKIRGHAGNKREGYARGNLLAGYTHLHFASNPSVAKRFIVACRNYRDSKKG
jgi:cobyrinic acid a,c-diamide synthase